MTPDESKMLKSLHDAVCGDEEYGVKGLIEHHEEIRKDVQSLKTWRTWLTGAWVGATAILGSITYLKLK